MLQEKKYDSVQNHYSKVSFNEFAEESEDDNHYIDPLLILKRKKIRNKLSTNIGLSRIISKYGKLNIFLKQLSHKNMYYMRDLGNTLLGIRWRWIIITLFLVNMGSFLFFGTLWWIIARNSGDLERTNATDPCVVNTITLTGYFLLSAETITTIGYGYRYPTERCQFGWFMQAIQILFGMAVQGTLVGIVYVKITKPITTKSSSLFSKRAVICMRDGKLRFVFRIHDFNKKVWCGTNISLYFLDKEMVSPDSEFEMIQMKIEPYGLLIFPLEIEHIINENSPLWTFRPLDILNSRFEIIAVAEGISNKTGQVSQNRTSYSNSDILWGYRFMPCVAYDEMRGGFVVDYKKFKQVRAFDAPLCSAKKLTETYKKISKIDEQS